jgi:hypothetical protein
MTFRLGPSFALVLAVLAPAAARAQAVFPAADDRGSFGIDGGPRLEDDGRRSSLPSLGERLEFGPVGMGLHVAPRRPSLGLLREGAGGDAPGYRLADTSPRTTDIGLDLQLRWPSAVDPTVGALTPYLSVGPAVSVTPPEESPFAAVPARTDPTLALGLRGALGITWRVSPAAAFFGEYRLIQERPLGSRAGGEVGADLFYGFSFRF